MAWSAVESARCGKPSRRRETRDRRMLIFLYVSNYFQDNCWSKLRASCKSARQRRHPHAAAGAEDRFFKWLQNRTAFGYILKQLTPINLVVAFLAL
jgi:hypothetical protein